MTSQLSKLILISMIFFCIFLTSFANEDNTQNSEGKKGKQLPKATKSPSITDKSKGLRTHLPTDEPTPKPQVPTSEPTSKPSFLPTAEPTSKPSSLPTAEPTSKPTADPIPQPTPLPTPEPTPPTCFPGKAIVTVGDRDIKMEDLQYGDYVKCVDRQGKIVPREVYLLGHRMKDDSSDYVNLVTVSGHVLQLSACHFVPVVVADDNISDKHHSTPYNIKYIPGGDVSVGDKLLVVGDDNVISPSVIVEVYSTREKGIYAPFVRDGDLIVNGVVASPYATFFTRIFPFVTKEQDYNMLHMSIYPIYVLYYIIGRHNMERLFDLLNVHGQGDGVHVPLLNLGKLFVLCFGTFGIILVPFLLMFALMSVLFSKMATKKVKTS